MKEKVIIALLTIVTAILYAMRIHERQEIRKVTDRILTVLNGGLNYDKTEISRWRDRLLIISQHSSIDRLWEQIGKRWTGKRQLSDR